MDIFRIFDSLNYLPNMKAAMEAVQDDARDLRRRDLLHRRHPRPEARQVFAEVLRRRSAKELEQMGAHILGDQGHGRPLPPLRGAGAGEGAEGRDRHPDSFPHARHERHQCRLDPARERCGRGCRGSRDRVDERLDHPAEPEFDRRRAAAHAARHRARPRRAQRVLRLLGAGARLSTRRSTPRRSPAAPRSISHEMPGGQYTNLKEQAAAHGPRRIAGRRSRAPTPR